jgi:hypothetical protein
MHFGLSIVFTGLCALVMDGKGGAGQMLLVDAKGIGEVRGVELPEHAATLVVSLSSLANAETSGPDRVALSGGAPVRSGSPEQIGLWNLAGSELRIRVQGERGPALRLFEPAAGRSSWPEPPRDVNNPTEWRDPRYVAQMKWLAEDGRIDSSLLVDDARASDSLPRSVAARIYLEGGMVEGAIPSNATHRDDLFEFRTGPADSRLRQALTDTVRWTLDSTDGVVSIEITPVTGGHTRRLVFKPGALQHTAFVSNLPVENVASHTHHAISEEEMAALHFGAYYKLLMNRPAFTPLPFLSTTAISRGRTGMMGSIFCPPAIFERD